MDLEEAQQQIRDRIYSTRIVRQLFSGGVQSKQYRAYISDVYSYALHSAQVIAHAGTRLALTHPTLAQYLFRHAEEELGHDKWAESDLLDLGYTNLDVQQIVPSSPCLRMVALEYYMAVHANPVGLFGWMFVLESLGGMVGGKIAAALDETLKLGGKGTYFLKGHGEADTHHSVDLCKKISQGVTSAADKAAFEQMQNESLDLYCGILDAAFDV